MTQWKNTFNGGANAATVGASDSGNGDLFTAISGVTYSNAHIGAGAMGAKVAAGLTSATGRLAISDAKTAIGMYVYLVSAHSGTDLDLIQVDYTGPASASIFRVNSATKARLITAGSINQATDTVNFPNGQLVWVSLYLEAGTSTITGKAQAGYYIGTTLTWDSTLITGINTAAATATFINVRGGKYSSGVLGQDVFFDELTIYTGADATGLIPPPTNAPPTASYTANQNLATAVTASVTLSGTDSDGTVTGYSHAVTYPASGGPTLTGATSATATFTTPAVGSLVILTGNTVDNLGATSTPVTTEVRVPSSAASFSVLAGPGVTTGTVTKVGGAASNGETVSDASDATYMEITSGGSYKARAVPIVTRTGYVWTFRLGSDTTANATAALYQGATLLTATGTAVGTIALTTTPTDFVATVTTPATVTDPGDVYLLVTAL